MRLVHYDLLSFFCWKISPSILATPHAGNAPVDDGESEGAEVSRTYLGLEQYRLLSSKNSHRICPFPRL